MVYQRPNPARLPNGGWRSRRKPSQPPHTSGVEEPEPPVATPEETAKLVKAAGKHRGADKNVLVHLLDCPRFGQNGSGRLHNCPCGRGGRHVSREYAEQLVDDGYAEWVVTLQNGKPYKSSNSIVVVTKFAPPPELPERDKRDVYSVTGMKVEDIAQHGEDNRSIPNAVLEANLKAHMKLLGKDVGEVYAQDARPKWKAPNRPTGNAKDSDESFWENHDNSEANTSHLYGQGSSQQPPSRKPNDMSTIDDAGAKRPKDEKALPTVASLLDKKPIGKRGDEPEEPPK
jgi:hypothetical protein